MGRVEDLIRSICRDKGTYAYLDSGSFLRGYQEGIPSYVEDAGMAATELGYGHIEVKNGTPSKVECVKV